MLFSLEFDILINKCFVPSLVVRQLGGYGKEVENGKGSQDKQKDNR